MHAYSQTVGETTLLCQGSQLAGHGHNHQCATDAYGTFITTIAFARGRRLQDLNLNDEPDFAGSPLQTILCSESVVTRFVMTFDTADFWLQ